MQPTTRYRCGRFFVAVALCLTALGCRDDEPKPSLPTIADPLAYLVRSVDGKKQQAGDPITVRRYDYGRYIMTDGFVLGPNRAVTTWDQPPFGSYNLPHDGGEQYVIEGDTVRIEGTRDGGRAYNQYFVGKGCGGTGWVLFRTDASAEWRSLVARLSIADKPDACPPLGQALTRYALRDVTFPVIGTRKAIVSEHYNTGSLDAPAAERSFFVEGLGRVAWQAFANHPPAVPDIAQRCPDFGWQTLGSLTLVDCRISVHTEPVDGSFTGDLLWALGK